MTQAKKMTLEDIINTQKELARLKQAALAEQLRCPEGGQHEWSYRGAGLRSYRCNKCGFEISKADLKEATD